MKKYNSIFGLFLLLLIVSITACQEDIENFDSKVVIGEATNKVGTYLLKPGLDEMTQVLKATVPTPAITEIHITYKADPSLVDQYNLAYYNTAVALPETCYDLTEPTAIIHSGSVTSTEVTINFKNLTSLDKDLIYVLPITVADTNWELLESTRTNYYVFKGAALINTVANIKERRLQPALTNASVLNNMRTITVEVLIRADELKDKISTLIGIEGKFLLRFSDNGLPGNQLQIATGSGNATNSNWTIETGKWVHIAFTYNGITGQSELFVDGISRGNGDRQIRTIVNWGVSYPREDETDNRRGFWIGYSYDTPRYFDGDISECRIWNRILTAEEIQAKDHFYYTTPQSEGLVAYWKFDEGQGINVTDYANGNNLTANKELTWKAVELPAKK